MHCGRVSSRGDWTQRLRCTVFCQWTSADVAALCRGRLGHNQLIDPTDDQGLMVRIIDRHASIFTVSKGANLQKLRRGYAYQSCFLGPALLPGPCVAALDDVSSGQRHVSCRIFVRAVHREDGGLR